MGKIVRGKKFLDALRCIQRTHNVRIDLKKNRGRRGWRERKCRTKKRREGGGVRERKCKTKQKQNTTGGEEGRMGRRMIVVV